MTTTTETATRLKFRETITSADGTVEETKCGEEHTLYLLRTAVRRGYLVEATQCGGAVITRLVPTGRPGGPRRLIVAVEPELQTGKITETVRDDLDAILELGRGQLLGNGRIAAGYIFGIPLAASARLIGRGLVSVDGTAVTVSLAARLAMLAADHQTRTSVPRGYYHPADYGENSAGLNCAGYRNGKLHDRTSTAICACRWSYPADDRDDARRQAHKHKQEVAAALVQSLS